jgi:hypothetical protein
VSETPPTLLVWFAVLGGALAWTTQFVANLFLTFARCNDLAGHRMVPLHALEVALSIAAVVVALAAAGVALQLFRRTARVDDVAEAERQGEGTPPPVGRINFLAMMGLLVNFLALVIIVMTAFGAPLTPICQQS